MECHIKLLTKLCGQHQAQGLLQPMTMVSHPNSPPRSDSPLTSSPISSSLPPVVFPNIITSSLPPLVSDFLPCLHTIPNPFPPLLSEPKDYAPIKEGEAATPPVVATVVCLTKESKEHIIPINSRQA
jgi:hypothetical protein